MGKFARGDKTLAVSEFSSRHNIRREIFVKTDTPFIRPSRFAVKAASGLVFRPYSIETFNTGNVNIDWNMVAHRSFVDNIFLFDYLVN
jgi:hypothetical protein